MIADEEISYQKDLLISFLLLDFSDYSCAMNIYHKHFSYRFSENIWLDRSINFTCFAKNVLQIN